MGDKKKNSGFKKFFQENRSLVISVPILLVLIVALLLVYILNGRNDEAEVQQTPDPVVTEQPAESTPVPTEQPSDDKGTEVTTLPQDEREKDQSEIIHNPFAEPYTVSGIIYDKSGGSIAIIEAENKTYIVEAGDEVDEYFKVTSIESDRVVLEIDGQEVVLTLSAND